MFICICNSVRESDLRHAARTGARTAEQAYAALGKEVSCAQCLEYAQNIIDEESRPHARTG